MSRNIDWDSRIGHRIKLRDLHVFSTVVRRGSMAKAAAHLGVSQPAVSELIAGLEQALGVPLLDRSRRGVEPTIYGRALLKGGTAAFDDLKQSIKEIEFLADPTAGELRIGCAESIAAAMLPSIIDQFLQKYPSVQLHVRNLVAPTLQFPELRERSIDLALTRFMRPPTREDEDLNVEMLFDDRLIVAAGSQSRWAQCHKIELAELAKEPWILTPPDSWVYENVRKAFRARGLDMPKSCLMTFSVHLRAHLLATGRYITVFPTSVFRFNGDRFDLKELQIDLPIEPWPFAVVTLKNRTLNPVAQFFIDYLRAFMRSMAVEPGEATPSVNPQGPVVAVLAR